MRRWSCRRWHWFPIDSIWLHQFDSSSIGIEKVRLPLAVLTDLHLDRSGVVLARWTRFEQSDGLINIRCDQANVILSSPLFRVRRLGVKHELEIILRIRNSHIDPTQLCAGCAAPPEFLEAKDIAIEFQRRLERAN